MSTKEIYTAGGNCSDLPLHRILYEWIVKNISITTDTGTIMAYFGLVLVTWYAIVWVTRFIMTIIWPLFLIASAYVIFRILQVYEPEEIADIISKSLTTLADILVMILANSLKIVLSFFD